MKRLSQQKFPIFENRIAESQKLEPIFQSINHLLYFKYMARRRKNIKRQKNKTVIIIIVVIVSVIIIIINHLLGAVSRSSAAPYNIITHKR